MQQSERNEVNPLVNESGNPCPCAHILRLLTFQHRNDDGLLRIVTGVGREKMLAILDYLGIRYKDEKKAVLVEAKTASSIIESAFYELENLGANNPFWWAVMP